MSHESGAYLGGIRTLEDLRIRCRMDDCGCWVWGMGKSHGRPCVTMKIEGKHKHIGGRRVALVLAGKVALLTSNDVVWQSDDCQNILCVNPAHCIVGTQAQAAQAAHRRNGWKRHAQWQLAGKRIKAVMAKLDDTKAAEIRASDERGRVLAERYGVSVSAVSMVKRGKSWLPPGIANSVFALGSA